MLPQKCSGKVSPSETYLAQMKCRTERAKGFGFVFLLSTVAERPMFFSAKTEI